MQDKPHREETGPQLNIEGAGTPDLKRNAFSTPANYFDDLTPRIMQSVRESQGSRPSAFDWNSLLGIRVLAPALSVILIAVLSIHFLGDSNPGELDFEKMAMSMTLEELDLFAEFETNELLAYDLVDYGRMSAETNARGDVDPDDVLDYLMDEDELELNTIIEELEI